VSRQSSTPEPLRIHNVHEFHMPPTWHLREHVHATGNEIVVVARGQLRTRIKGESVVARLGSALLYPETVPHEEWASGGQPLSLYHITWTGNYDRDGRDWPLVCHDQNGRILVLMRWLLDLFPPKSPVQEETMFGILRAILFEYMGGTGQRPEDRMVLAIKRHVRDNIAKSIRLEDLAGAAHMSKYHFARMFRASTGVAPMTFVRNARVEAARTLLQTSPLPLRAIAPMVGFADEFQLSRVFRHVTGTNPSTIRTLHTNDVVQLK
jgi:AraC-like DNA-binding protein/mannose-6-phosphate isomerase-like protein (cupin superfamily)